MNRRPAYSLLELLIALGLVGALLAVAWSLLSTYQKAEITAWNLVERTQAIRLVRETLERDLLQVVFPETQDLEANSTKSDSGYSDGGFGGSILANSAAPSSGAKFYGNSYGFTALIKPSVDPMPVFHQLFNGDHVDTTGDKLYGISAERNERDGLGIAQMTLSTSEPITIEYRIRPEPDWGNRPTFSTSANSERGVGFESEHWLLVRSELQEYSEWANASADKIESPERELNASDLYRNVDDEQNKSMVKQQETVVARLGRAKFSYFDGLNWQSSWSIDTSRQFPKAVALTFDLAKASGPPARPPNASPEIDSESLVDSIQEPSEYDASDWSTVSGEIAEADLDSEQAGDLRIVIRLWQMPTGQNRVDE